MAAENATTSTASPNVLRSLSTWYRIPWYRVQARLRWHPEEACEPDDDGCSFLYRVLSLEMADYPPADVVRACIEAYPPAIWDQRASPLEAACRRRAPLPIIVLLTHARPSMPHDLNALNALWNSYDALFEGNGMSVVDQVCEGGREGAEIWTRLCLLLRYCTDPSLSLATWQGLHAAAAAQSCSVELFELILKSNPGATKQRDRRGRLPLHCLMSEPKGDWKAKLEMLLEEFPEALRLRDYDGHLPLHLAVIAGQSLECVDLLIRSAPDTLSKRDKSLLFPFQLAAMSSDASTSLSFHLLHAAPHLLMKGPDVARASVPLSHESKQAVIKEVPAKFEDCHCYSEDVLEKVGSKPEMWNQLLRLLRIDTTCESVSSWRVLHAVSSLSAGSPTFLKLAMRLYPEELHETDNAGRLPLHLVCSLPSSLFKTASQFEDDDDYEDERSKRVKTVLEGFPLATRVCDNRGSLPLHTAVCAGQPWSSLDPLLRAAPDTIWQREGWSKLYPFQLAACSPAASLDELYLLIRAAPHLL